MDYILKMTICVYDLCCGRGERKTATEEELEQREERQPREGRDASKQGQTEGYRQERCGATATAGATAASRARSRQWVSWVSARAIPTVT